MLNSNIAISLNGLAVFKGMNIVQWRRDMNFIDEREISSHRRYFLYVFRRFIVGGMRDAIDMEALKPIMGNVRIGIIDMRVNFSLLNENISDIMSRATRIGVAENGRLNLSGMVAL